MVRLGRASPVQVGLSSDRRGGRTEHRQPDRYCRALTDFALYADFAAVQIDAPLNDHQTETGAWTVIDIVTPMEGVKEPLPIGLRNADPLVADETNHFCSGAFDFQSNRLSGILILHRVG